MQSPTIRSVASRHRQSRNKVAKEHAVNKALVSLAATLSLAFVGLVGPHSAVAAGQVNAIADQNPGHLKMALVSMKCVYSDNEDDVSNKANIEANLKRHLYFVDQAAAQGCDFVGFPELSVNGYHFSQHMTWLSLAGPEVKTLARKAVEKGVYISAGIAEQDSQGKKWNTQFVIGLKGDIVGWHHKIWLTKEKGFTEAGPDHNVFEVKGVKMGISTCADGTDQKNLQALVENGAQVIYAPHANTTGGTTAGWYKFRAAWGGASGWIAQLKVHAALHNQAGLYEPRFEPPVTEDRNTGWASGAWFIGPDGQTLAQMPSSTEKSDSREFMLVYSIPIPKLIPSARPPVQNAK